MHGLDWTHAILGSGDINRRVCEFPGGSELGSSLGDLSSESSLVDGAIHRAIAIVLSRDGQVDGGLPVAILVRL